MDITRLQRSPIGTLVPIRGVDARTLREFQHFAYLPDPLPTEVALEQGTWRMVAEASSSLGQLRQVCDQLPNPRLLITPALAKEAQATSALEGTYGTLPDVLEARLPGFEPRTPEIREIRGYEKMASHGFESVTDREITIGLLCDLQKILAHASRHPSKDPGQVRKDQVVIGAEDAPVEDSRFVPPPPGDQLAAGLQAWQQWVTTDHDLPIVVRAAMAHYQFETLHPFNDGNGRVGRLVILLQLLREGTLEAASLTISPWFLKRRREYQDALFDLSCTGEWDPWIRFFCRALMDQCGQHVEVAKQLLTWLSGVRHQLVERRWTGLIANLTEKLIEWPIVTNVWVQQEHGVKAPTAQSAIDRLVEIGVLKELTGRNYRRVYGATAVMNLVESL
ncbi:MAG TPA: Fic family protein [Acidimicrobiales bacterium]|nr:Fic family protein [Acidimicrobiales bacterium]